MIDVWTVVIGVLIAFGITALLLHFYNSDKDEKSLMSICYSATHSEMGAVVCIDSIN